MLLLQLLLLLLLLWSQGTCLLDLPGLLNCIQALVKWASIIHFCRSFALFKRQWERIGKKRREEERRGGRAKFKLVWQKGERERKVWEEGTQERSKRKKEKKKSLRKESFSFRWDFPILRGGWETQQSCPKSLFGQLSISLILFFAFQERKQPGGLIYRTTNNLPLQILSRQYVGTTYK